MPKITLRMTQENKTQVIECAKKANLLKTLQAAGIPIGSACGGHGLCASCKIQVLQGAKNLSSPNDTELDLCDRNQIPESERISCQTQVLGDIEITTTYW